MDRKQAEIIEKYQESALRERDRSNDEENNSSDDDLLELLDDDDEVLSKYREARVEQLSKQLRKIDKATGQRDNFGSVTEFSDEKTLMSTITKEDIAIVHFYQPQFEKCKIMNDRLAVIAEKHLTLFVSKIRAEDAPFLVTKLDIKVLPFVLVYRKGKELCRLVGFENISRDANNISVEELERFLYLNNAIDRRTINFGATRKSINANSVNSDDDDLDL